MGRALEDFGAGFSAWIRKIPNTDRQSLLRGKTSKFTDRTASELIRCFYRHVAPAFRDIDNLVEDNIVSFAEWAKLQKGTTPYYAVRCVMLFIDYLHELGVVSVDSSELKKKHNIRYMLAPTKIRSVPAVDEERLVKLKRSGRTLDQKIALALIFNGFRLSEITWLDWAAFPGSFFSEYRIGQTFKTKRKGGEIWDCVVDRYAWSVLREKWAKTGMPMKGKVVNLTPSTIYSTFVKFRNRIFYYPEDAPIRKQLTPHTVRHIWARNFCAAYPNLAAMWVGAVLGGWRPGSTVYSFRYVNPMQSFNSILAASMKDVDLFPSEAELEEADCEKKRKKERRV